MAKVHGAKDDRNLCTLFIQCLCAFNAIAGVLGGFRVGEKEAKKWVKGVECRETLVGERVAGHESACAPLCVCR